jgi:hypothetical protein
VHRYQLWLATVRKVVRGAIDLGKPVRYNGLYPIPKKDSKVKIREITDCTYTASSTAEHCLDADISTNEGTPDCFRRTCLPLLTSFENTILFFIGFWYWVADFME